jgi:hypothetical protein
MILYNFFFYDLNVLILNWLKNTNFIIKKKEKEKKGNINLKILMEKHLQFIIN